MCRKRKTGEKQAPPTKRVISSKYRHTEKSAWISAWNTLFSSLIYKGANKNNQNQGPKLVEIPTMKCRKMQMSEIINLLDLLIDLSTLLFISQVVYTILHILWQLYVYRQLKRYILPVTFEKSIHCTAIVGEFLVFMKFHSFVQFCTKCKSTVLIVHFIINCECLAASERSHSSLTDHILYPLKSDAYFFLFNFSKLWLYFT